MDPEEVRRVAALDQNSAAVADLARICALFYRTLRAEKVPVHVARELTTVCLTSLTRAGRPE